MSLDGMNPVFAARLQAMAAAAEAEGTSIGWGSGARSIEEQIALRKSNGCPDVWTAPASSCRIPTAIPGRSNHHDHGNGALAMDITGDKAWANANAHRFGLHFPVKGEDWHVEMIDDDDARGEMAMAQQRGAIGFDMEWQSEQRTPEDELGWRLDTIMGMLTGEPPSPDAPDQGTQPGDLAMDSTMIAGGDPSTRMVPGGGGSGASVEGEPLENARLIVQIGRQRGMPDKAIQIALATGLVESELRNLNYGDRDSQGIFQQRPSQGWGTVAQVTNPHYATNKFYDALSKIDWQNMDPGAAAQAVQRSAFPERYGQRWAEAQSIFQQVGH